MKNEKYTQEELQQMSQEELIALAKQQPPHEVPWFVTDEDEASSGAWQNLPPPTHVRTKSATEIFGMKPGETWEEYFARTNAAK